MSEKAQNDWDVIQDALQEDNRFMNDEALVALQRLREFTEITISGLNQRIIELEDEKEGWPVPADTPVWSDSRKHSWNA